MPCCGDDTVSDNLYGGTLVSSGDPFQHFPKTTEEQVLEQLKEIKELLRRQDPTSTQPGKHLYAPPCHGNPWCPCRHYGPYWEIPFTITCGGTYVHSFC